MTRRLLLFLGVLVAGFPVTAATAAPNDPTITCTSPNSKLSAIVIRMRSCVRASGNFDNYDPADAYHQLMITVVPQPAFTSGAQFRNDAGPAGILRNVIYTIFKVSKPRSLFLTLEIGDGVSQEPVITPVSFRYDDAQKTYTSNIILNTTSMRHRLPTGNPLTVVLKAVYSDRASFDPSQVVKAVRPAFGATDFLVSAAAKPLLDVAKDVASAALNSSSASFDATATMNFSPQIGDSTREELLVVDPTDPRQWVATITLQLVSARSLLAGSQLFENGANALPVVPPAGGSIDISAIGKKVVVGQASLWPLPASAVASATTTTLPATATKPDVSKFCDTVASNLTGQFSLSQFDRVLVEAKAVQLTTAGSAGRTFNPYKTCFTAGELASVATYLPNVDITDPPPPPAPPPSSINDQAKFDALGCWLKGSPGDQCGTLAAARTRLSAMLDDKVALPQLEGLDGVPDISANLPADRMVDREDFLNRFGGKFTRFHDYDLGAGTMLVNVGPNGPDLVVSGSVKNGKITSVSFRHR